MNKLNSKHLVEQYLESMIEDAEDYVTYCECVAKQTDASSLTFHWSEMQEHWETNLKTLKTIKKEFRKWKVWEKKEVYVCKKHYEAMKK